MTLRRAIFLDRDGTLNRPAKPGAYITDPSALELLAGVTDAVAQLRRAGYLCVVASNQRGVALGLMSHDDLQAIDRRLRELVAIDHAYYCTHGLQERCPCRKPRAGLLIRASAELGIDLARSWMIGDTATDREAGRRAGCQTIRIAAQDGALLAAVGQIVACSSAPALAPAPARAA